MMDTRGWVSQNIKHKTAFLPLRAKWRSWQFDLTSFNVRLRTSCHLLKSSPTGWASFNKAQPAMCIAIVYISKILKKNLCGCLSVLRWGWAVYSNDAVTFLSRSLNDPNSVFIKFIWILQIWLKDGIVSKIFEGQVLPNQRKGKFLQNKTLIKMQWYSKVRIRNEKYF